jgi:hypothetical protein
MTEASTSKRALRTFSDQYFQSAASIRSTPASAASA